MSTSATVWPQLGTTVTLDDGVTVIDEDGRVLVLTAEVLELLRTRQLLTYDPRIEPTTSPDEGPSGHAAQHILGAAQEIDGDKLAIGFIPNYYIPTPTAEGPDVDHLAAHLRGAEIAIEVAKLLGQNGVAAAAAAQSTADAAAASASAAAAAAAAAAADAADAAAAAASLDTLQCSAVYSWEHFPQTGGASTQRKMWPGYNNAAYPGGADTVQAPVVLIPADGEIFGFTARHVVSATVETDTLTYIVYKANPTNAHSMTDTAATIAKRADDGTLGTSAAVVAVSAGDLVGVRYDCSGAITGMPAVSAGGGCWASFMYRRTA